MVTIKIIQEDIDHAKKVISTHKIGLRGDGTDGTKRNKAIGVLAEACFSRLLGLDYDEDYSKYDNGVDFEIEGTIVDLKSSEWLMHNNQPFRCYTIAKSQVESETSRSEVYLVCNVDLKTMNLTLLGWVERDDVRARKGQTRLIHAGETYTMRDGNTNTHKITGYRVYAQDFNKFYTVDMFKGSMAEIAKNKRQLNFF